MIITTNGRENIRVDPVDLLDTMGSDNAVCDAARVSFSKDASQFTDEQNNRLLGYLAEHNHWSPFAHCFMKFRFKAPIFVARQFQKHVVGFAWNEVSRRYVDTTPTFFVPTSYRKRPANMKQGSVAEGETPIVGQLMDAYKDKVREHVDDYTHMINQGICPEQARMFMPQSMMTEWIWTGGLMAWARFVKLRSDSHAQAECWGYASRVEERMRDNFPAASEALLSD